MWKSLSKDPLIGLLENAVQANQKALDGLIETKMLPPPSVCCTKCDKAVWHVSDKVLACLCKEMSVITWESSMLGLSVGTTLCGEVLKQALRKNADENAVSEPASKRPERQESSAAAARTH